MTLALILVDLDNVLPEGGLPELVEDCRPVLEKHRGVAGTCVTAFAFNTDTALTERLDFGALRSAARGFADAIGARTHALEVGLTLTMPQTADVLLARLVERAPTQAGAGDLVFGALLSKDRDLEHALHAAFGASRSGWLRAHRGWPLSAWRGERGVLHRVAESPKTPKGRELLDLTASYTEPVGRAHTVHVAERPVDADQGELVALAQLADDDPWILSQLGATKGSLRGLGRALDATMPLGVVCADDGIEIRGERPRPSTVTRAEPASVGIGAARFPDERATLPCRIPVEVLSHAASVRLEGRRGVFVRPTLQGLPLERRLSSSAVNVRLQGTRRGLVAKVQMSSTAQPSVWWISGDRRTESEWTVAGARDLVPGTVWTRGVAFRPDGRTRSRLALRTELEEGERVRVERPVGAGTIGQAYTIPTYGKARPIAVFARRHVPAGELDVVPIQCSHHAPDELTDLPLVVPT